LVPPSWCPHRSCSRSRIFVDRNQKRRLISRALGVQLPNPGSVSRRARCEIFDFSPLAMVLFGFIVQWCHKTGLESSSRGANPTETHSRASPTQLEGFRSGPRETRFLDVSLRFGAVGVILQRCHSPNSASDRVVSITLLLYPGCDSAGSAATLVPRRGGHKRGLGTSSRGVNRTNTHSQASPTQLEAFRGPNSDPAFSTFCPTPPPQVHNRPE
jgi:hypothetical protein